MGVTKQYLRFVPGPSFGIVGSAKGGAVIIPNSKGLVAAAKAEHVVIWNTKTGEQIRQFIGEKHEVTRIAINEQGSVAAVGYRDGNIKLFNVRTGECEVTLSGHRSAVTCLTFDQTGLRLASGARDTCIILWDVVNECGLFRLQGHKGPITNCEFMVSRNVLVSSSKDTRVKFWDLDIQHCFKTLPGHMTEVWDFVLVKDEQYLITGSSDSELRVWKLTFTEGPLDTTAEITPTLKKLKVADEEEEEETFEDEASNLTIERLGSVLREGQDKVSELTLDRTGQLILCHGSDNTLELFAVCPPEEVKKRLQKKAKKERRKIAGKGGTVEEMELPEPTIQEEFRRLKVVKCSGRVKSVDVEVQREKAKILVLTGNNILEYFGITLTEKNAEAASNRKFDLPGHRSDVRTVAFSSENTAIASASHEALKIWSRSTQTCIRTMPSGYGLCSLFVPGDRHVLLGTKSGAIQIFDLGSSDMTEEVNAHEKEVWSMCPHGKRGFVTSSGDQTVKFWDYELLTAEGETSKRLSIVHTRTLQLEEDALCVRVSPDGRLIAVSLLDSTVKVFFVDTLKFFLSLYGHKLPALTTDISTDSTLIVTGSADRNIKIWGLDFGDCHKSIFAHDDSVTAVQFIPNTHMFFSCGKDGKVKQWDADNFERILTLDGHFGEVWSLAISPNGKFVVTSGHDKTLRLWERTQEPLVLEDERETEREADDEILTGDRATDRSKEATMPSKKTAETERGAERLMEAIELHESHTQEETDHAAECQAQGKEVTPLTLPPLMAAYPDVRCADDFMMLMITKIRSSELEETLLVLPLDYVTKLLQAIEHLLTKRYPCEVLSRTFYFLVELHFGPLSASPSLLPLLKRLNRLVEERLNELGDVIGYNMAALKYVTDKTEEKERVQEFIDATVKFKEKKRKKKNKQKAIQTAILSI